MPASRHDFTQGPLLVPLARFCVPLLASSLLQSATATINAIWVGRLIGPPALAAVTNANLLLFLLLGGAFGLVGAASIAVSQAVGADHPQAARRTIGGSATWFMLLAGAIAAGCAVTTPALLELLAVPAGIRAMCTAYLHVSLATIPASYMFVFVTSMMRSSGEARLPFVAILLATALDIVLTPLLIGAGMGVAGSALASGLSQGLALAILLVQLHRRGEVLLPRLEEFRPTLVQLRLLVTKGLPMGLQTLVVASASLVLVQFVNRFGVTTVAAYGAAAQLWSLVQMPAFAVSSGLMIAAAQNIGAGEAERVRQATWAALTIQAATTGALVLATYLGGSALLGIFTRDGATVAEAVYINRLVAWSFVFLGASFVLFAPLRAAGQVAMPLVVSIIALWVIRVPFIALTLPAWGAEAIWLGIALGAAISIVLSVALYAYGSPASTARLPLAKTPEPEGA